MGKDVDIKLAKKLPSIDVIIGGHSHTSLDSPLKINNTLIVQAGFWATSFGYLKLDLKKTDNYYIIDNYSFELMPMREKSSEETGF